MFIVTKKPFCFFIYLFHLPLSPMCLLLTYTVCCEEIQSNTIFFSFSERTFDIIFKSTFNKAMDLQFCMDLLSLSFFLLTY